MLQVSVFTIKFWSIVSERRVSDFVNLSTITNHSEQHLYFEIENSTPNRSYLTSPNTRRYNNVTNYSCMLEKVINYAGKTKLLLNLISRANFNFFKQLNKYQDELDRDLKKTQFGIVAGIPGYLQNTCLRYTSDNWHGKHPRSKVDWHKLDLLEISN